MVKAFQNGGLRSIRAKIFHALIERVNEERAAIEIISQNGNVVIMPADEYAAWRETAHLFRLPVNARRLLDAYDRSRSGKTELHELDRGEVGAS